MKSLWFLGLLLCSCAPKKSSSVYRDIQKTLSEGTEQYTNFELSKIFIEQRTKEYEERLAKNPDYTCLINRDLFPREEPNPYYVRGRVVLPQIPTRDEMKRFKDVRFFVFLDKEVTVDDIARLRREDKLGHITFEHVSHLNKEVAQEIVRLKTNSLSFPRLKHITPEALQEFTKWKGSYLSLRGLEEIDDELYELFSALPIRSLSLRMYKDIDLETAKKLKPLFAKGLGLSGVHDISLDVVDEWRDIRIPSFAIGSDDVDMETLRALSKMKISSLSLYGLTSFSEEQAEALQSFRGKSLSLDKVKDMSGETLATLASYKKITDIGVRCLQSIDPIGAKAIASLSTSVLELPSVQKLDVETAKEIAKARKWAFDLRGLRELSYEVAQELAKTSTRTIKLYDLETFDPKVFEFYKTNREPLNFDFDMYFHDLEVLSPEHTRGLFLHPRTNIQLNSLRSLSQETADTLRENPPSSLSLNGITILTPTEASLLSLDVRSLSLNGLQSIDAPTMKALLNNSKDRNMTFDGLTELNSQVALVLASSALGSIYSFGQIKQLTPELVRVLFENAPETGQYKHLSLDFPSVRSLDMDTIQAIKEAREKRGLEKDSIWLKLPSLEIDTPQKYATLCGFGIRSFYRRCEDTHLYMRNGSVDWFTVLMEQSLKDNGFLYFKELETVTVEEAQRLAQFEGRELTFLETNMDLEVIQALMAFGGDLMLSIRNVTPEHVNVLMEFQGSTLKIRNVESISDEDRQMLKSRLRATIWDAEK